MTERTVPVYILSGFLGSGKTTLLGEALRLMKGRGLRPAVVMNELGEVNLDGVAVGTDVPMAEMLDGCICCTVRGDLSLTIQQLMEAEKPDVLFIEATGVANPMEILDGVTEASLFMRVEIQGVITVTDAALLKDELAKAKGKTYRLLQEQIRCADVLVLNKTDLLPDPAEQEALETALRAWNPYAKLYRTERARIDPSFFDTWERGPGRERTPPLHGHTHEHDHDHDCGEAGCDRHGHGEGYHHTHEHVMVYTRYLQGPVDSRLFEALVARLPESVYRAKGVLTFRDTLSRYLFQFAYRQPDFMKIMPQGSIPDVLVFIGENIPKDELEAELDRLEAESGGTETV